MSLKRGTKMIEENIGSSGLNFGALVLCKLGGFSCRYFMTQLDNISSARGGWI